VGLSSLSLPRTPPLSARGRARLLPGWVRRTLAVMLVVLGASLSLMLQPRRPPSPPQVRVCGCV